MFEAYSVAVTLRVNNLVSPQLALIAGEFEKLERLAISLKSTLRVVAEDSAGLRALTRNANASSVALDRTVRSAERLQQHMATIHAAGSVPLVPGIGGGGARGPTLPGGGGNAGRGHGGRGGAHGGNIHMGPHGIGMGTFGMSAGDAFVPLAASAAMVYAGHSLYESAKDLNTETQRFKLFGLGDKLNDEAFKFVKGMQVYGSTTTQNMKNFREAQGVFRESGLNDSSALEGAKLAAPFLSKIAFATEALDDESKARMRTSGLSMLRWVEMSGGLQSASKFKELADFGWKLTQTSGGAVNWEQLRQFSATAGNAGRFLTPDGLAALEPLLGELKGGGAGTGLRTAANRLTGVVRLPNQAAHALVDAGIWDPSKVVWNKAGGIKQFTGNPFTSYDDFVKAPTQWYEKTMMPLYDKLHLSAAERGRENSMIFGGTGGRLFTLAELQMATSHRSVAALGKALPLDKSGDAAKQSLSGQEKEFTSAWTDFKTEFGTLMLPAFTNILSNSAKFMRSITGFISDNEAAVNGLMSGVKWLSTVTNPVGTLVSALFKLGGHESSEWGNEARRGAVGGSFTTNAGGAAFGSPNIRGAKTRAIQVDSTINIDGRQVAKAVTTHQEADAQRPATGGRRPDGSMSALGAGATATGSW